MISVIMASRNKAPVLPETLDSLLAQTHEAWELVVVDDASTDPSWTILEEYAGRDARIRIYRNDRPSGGPAGPRNRALGLARGDWIAVLDADDLWHDEKLERQLAAVRARDTPFCSTAALSFNGTAPPLSGPPHPAETRWVDHGQLLDKNVIAASSVLIRADVLRAVRFIEEPRYRRVEDACCWLRIHRDAVPRSIQLGERLTFYRRGPFWRLKGIGAARRLRMLREHTVGGRPLGMRALPHFARYAVASVASIVRTGGSFRSA